jgi:hypothetical protein
VRSTPLLPIPWACYEMVFITPEGGSNRLYVVNKTAAGFEVHENRGGRSTLAFSYRIVAKPFGPTRREVANDRGKTWEVVASAASSIEFERVAIRGTRSS